MEASPARPALIGSHIDLRFVSSDIIGADDVTRR